MTIVEVVLACLLGVGITIGFALLYAWWYFDRHRL
jgi:hypothetical protein